MTKIGSYKFGIFLSSIICSYLAHFYTQAQKLKKFNTEKNSLYFLKRKLFLYFRKWNPAIFKPSSKNKIIIIIIIIIHPKEISYTIVLKNFLYFRKWKPSKKLYFLKRMIFLYFGKRKPWKKIPCISGNETFLYFRKLKP